MDVLVLTPNVLGVSPGQRSSVELWPTVLEEAGIRLHFAPFETEELHEVLYRSGNAPRKTLELLRSYVGRIRLVGTISDFDAALVYREAALLGPAVFERLIARRRVPLIYQLDDPLYLPYRSPNNGYFSYLKFFGKVSSICRMSSVVIANSSPIRRFAERHNANVHQIPSLVDTDVYSFQPRNVEPPICVGWSGSPTTARNVTVIADALSELQKTVDYRLHLIGGTEFELPGVRYTAQPWRAETEVEDLRQFDIGLVPLPDNPWNREKFYLKVVQYMALGIPAVCTAIGSNTEVIDHGQTGFLAANGHDYITHLQTLIRDHETREEISHRVVDVARRHYSLAANAEKIVDAFNSAHSTRLNAGN